MIILLVLDYGKIDIALLHIQWISREAFDPETIILRVDIIFTYFCINYITDELCFAHPLSRESGYPTVNDGERRYC
jgi:hypothetical protein